MHTQNWIELAKDSDTRIETIHAHFYGHAYDPHWHDSYLVGVTESGIQQFHCGRRRHRSTSGDVFLINPGEIHDGDAPTPDGFSYLALYLEPQWLERELRNLFEKTPAFGQPDFQATVVVDPHLARAATNAFRVLHTREIRMVRQAALDTLLVWLTGQLRWRNLSVPGPRLPTVARQVRDFLHAQMNQDIGLEDLVRITGVSRFRLTRAFKAQFGLAPHAYLVQLRLTMARHLLAAGECPAQVAASLGFADQSHLGRWFSRAYRITPAQYGKIHVDLPACGGLYIAA
jgi:AraC-like DNA-binding protein